MPRMRISRLAAGCGVPGYPRSHIPRRSPLTDGARSLRRKTSCMTEHVGMGASVRLEMRAFRRAMRSLAAGVTVVTARDGGGRPCGLTATAVSAVSWEPPLLLVCIDRTADCHDTFMAADALVVNLLHEGQERLARDFSSIAGGQVHRGELARRRDGRADPGRRARVRRVPHHRPVPGRGSHHFPGRGHRGLCRGAWRGCRAPALFPRRVCPAWARTVSVRSGCSSPSAAAAPRGEARRPPIPVSCFTFSGLLG